MTESFNPKDPLSYLDPLYRAAKEYWASISPHLREQWDMYMTNDKYQNDREKMGLAHLSYPVIHVAIEAIMATVWKIMQTEQNLHVFDPKDPRNPIARIGAEELTAAFQCIRADLNEDDKIMEMVLATSIFSHCHMVLQGDYLPVEPGLGLMMQPADYGMEKLYPSWEMRAPGRIIYDGNYETQVKIPARFAESFVSYHELKREWPKQIGDWIRRYERPFDEVGFASRDAMNGMSDESIYNFYMLRAGVGKSAGQDSRRGFMLVQSWFKAIDDVGDVQDMVAWWLPEVVPQRDTTGIHKHGYVLALRGPSFKTVPVPTRICRSRMLPFTTTGRSTAELGIPFQRQLSAQVAQEMDMDQLMGSPPILMRNGVWIGRDDPAWSAREIWTVDDPTGASQPMRLDDLVKPMNMTQTNRQYLHIMDDKLSNMWDLVSAAVEATTGGETTDTNTTATAFQGRSSGAMSRIMVQFQEHAKAIIWKNQMHLRMMREAPQEFLYPPFTTYSQTLGAPGVLTERILRSAVNSRVPAISEYAGKELHKVMWRMVGDWLNSVPVYQNSPQLQMWAIERVVRAMGVSEYDVQEAMAAAQSGVEASLMMASAAGMPQQLGGGMPPGAPPMGPGQAISAGNLQPALNAAA